MTFLITVGIVAAVATWIAWDFNRYLEDVHDVPAGQPRPGVEWTRLGFEGPNGATDWARGEVVWAVQSHAEGTVVTARAVARERGVQATAVFSAATEVGSAFRVDIATDVPPEFGPMSFAQASFSERRLKLDLETWSRRGSVVDASTATLLIPVDERDEFIGDLQAFDVITFTIGYNNGLLDDGRGVLNLGLAFGDTGRAAFAEAFAAWGIGAAE